MLSNGKKLSLTNTEWESLLGIGFLARLKGLMMASYAEVYVRGNESPGSRIGFINLIVGFSREEQNSKGTTTILLSEELVDRMKSNSIEEFLAILSSGNFGEVKLPVSHQR